jgi:hypothetical protein
VVPNFPAQFAFLVNMRGRRRVTFSRQRPVSTRSSQVFPAWGDLAGAQAAALKQLWLMAYLEAQVQAFADAFLAIAMCFTVSVALVPLMRAVGSPRS